MQRALLAAMLGVAAIFLALTVLIVLEKAWRELRGAWRRGRRRVLEPLVLDYAHTMRWVVPGVTLTALGFQTVLSSFFVSILGLKKQ